MFMDITKELDNHIVTVLHTNPGGDKPRGHLGTNFLNKAQALFIVRADGDISTVSVERCRDIAVDDLPLLSIMKVCRFLPLFLISLIN